MKIDKEISSIDMAGVLWIWLMPFALAIAAVMGEVMDGNALNFWKVTSIIVFSYIVWFTIIFGLGGLGWLSERMKGTKQIEKNLQNVWRYMKKHWTTSVRKVKNNIFAMPQKNQYKTNQASR